MHVALKSAPTATARELPGDIEFEDLTTDSEPEDHHVCVKREEGGIWHWIQAWYLVPAHLVVCIAFWIFMTVILPGRTFAIGRGPELDSFSLGGRLYQSDMMTIIAAWILIVRLLAGVWQATATWRCVFLLLEKASASLGEVQFLVDYQILAPRNLQAHVKLVWVWLIMLVLILNWPAQVLEPLASGAVSWVPDFVFDKTNQRTMNGVIGKAEAGDQWGWYQNYTNTRQYIVQESAGLANLENYLLSRNSSILVPPARRPTLAFRYESNGTSIENMTVPLFQIQSFEWVTDPSSLPSDLKSAVENDSSGYLNISQPHSPLSAYDGTGVASILKTTKWSRTGLSFKRLPSPTIFNGRKYAAVAFSHYWGNASCSLKSMSSSIFKPLPDIQFLQSIAWNNYSTCYAVAELQLQASTASCRDTNNNGSGCSLSSFSQYAVVSHEDQIKALPDPLVDQVFDLMPDVMGLMMTTGGFTLSHTVFENNNQLVDAREYLQAALTLAYQGTWSAFTDRLTTNPESVNYVPPTQVVSASVSLWRMDLWLALNILLTLSCLPLAYLHAGSRRPILLSYILQLFLLDNSRILAQDASGLCNASHLNEEDEKIGRLGLRNVQARDSALAGFHHDVIKIRRRPVVN